MDPKWTKDLRSALDFELYFIKQTPQIEGFKKQINAHCEGNIT